MNYKELLKKYIMHVVYHESIDYLSEIKINDSGYFTEEEKRELINIR